MRHTEKQQKGMPCLLKVGYGESEEEDETSIFLLLSNDPRQEPSDHGPRLGHEAQPRVLDHQSQDHHP